MRAVIFFIVIAFCVFAIPAQADIIRLETKTNLRAVYYIPTPNSGMTIVHPVIIAGEADFDGPEGLAHYLEHLMFWHANKVDKKFSHGRGDNAWANGLITSYYAAGTKEEIDLLFRFAGRVLTTPTLDKKFMLAERDVVVREYDLRVSENPSYRAADVLGKKVLPNNPISRSTIGTPKSINSLTVEQALSFFEKHYTPANTVLLIASHLNPPEIIARVEKEFGGFPKGRRNEQNWRKSQPSGKLNFQSELKDPYVISPSLENIATVDWEGTGNRLDDIAIVRLTQKLLLSTLQGSLSKPLRIDNFVFSGFNINLFSALEKQIGFYFSGQLDDGVSHAAANDAFNKALAEIAKRGATEATVTRIRNRIIKAMKRKEFDARFMLGLATQSLSNGVLPESNSSRIKRLEKITSAQVNQVLRAIANADRWATMNLVPKGH